MRAKEEIIVFDLVNDKNVEDGGLGVGYGDFSYNLFQPQKKGQGERINEILLYIKHKILMAIMANREVLIIIQLGFWWWWKWKEERRLKELTTINNGLGWKSFTEEQKKKWIRWNKELNIIAERLIKWLTENGYRWIYVVDRKIKEFKRTYPVKIKESLNRNIKDVVLLILMYWKGLLKGFEEVRKRLSKNYYWDNYHKINIMKLIAKIVYMLLMNINNCLLYGARFLNTSNLVILDEYKIIAIVPATTP
ncbi:MAG: hypothetical protein MRERV_39c016 [Mycoplasmataceae bacterium RV_VA103A]|nr:MAG: hypothetical protein MRERV_39c016 [Mycoplasmataceae bacterium RV_VA103A]